MNFFIGWRYYGSVRGLANSYQIFLKNFLDRNKKL